MFDNVIHKLRFTFFSGKNSKWKYYVGAYWRLYVPRTPLRRRLPKVLAEARCRSDYASMERRRDYYCRKHPAGTALAGAPRAGDIRVKGQKVYALDTIRYTRWFDPSLPIRLLPGDITYVPDYPSVTKSRPITGDNANSVLLNLDRVRHFIFVNDRTPFRDKLDKALFRGKVGAKEQRMRFMEMYFGHPMIDAGDVSRRSPGDPAWTCPKLTLSEQLRHKFILAIEGNDVASNLKWIMSSNSVAVMPKPTCESWFMEGTLVGGYHYIEVKPDFSDLPEKLQYYIDHPDEAEAIIAHAHEHVAQFLDRRREDLIALMVLEKYWGDRAIERQSRRRGGGSRVKNKGAGAA